MWLETLATLGGGVARLVPELVKIWTTKQDHDHEYRMTQLQGDLDAKRGQQTLDLAEQGGAQAQVMAEIQALLEAIKDQSKPTGVPWVDGVNALLRPLITIWWVLGLYTAYKVHLIMWAYEEKLSLQGKADIICSEFDRGVVGSIIGYWFMDRTLRKMGRG